MFPASSILTLAALVGALGAEAQSACYDCISGREGNSFCTGTTRFFTPSVECPSKVCGKLVIRENGKMVEMRRYCGESSYKLGCIQTFKDSRVFEYCFCNEAYCNKAGEFTWSAFVSLPLVVCTVLAMF